MMRDNRLVDLTITVILSMLIAWVITMPKEAEAWTQPDKVWYADDATVTFTFYDLICNEVQSLAIEETLRYVASQLNTLDRSGRTYVYGGRVDTSSYGNWPTEVTKTPQPRIECNMASQMGGVYGRAVPVRVAGVLVGGGALLNQGMPAEVLQVVTLHEVSHMLGIKHGYYYDSLMRPAVRNDDETAYKVVWRQDTLCALQQQIPDMTWPVTNAVVTGKAEIYLPRLSWMGLNFEAWLLPESGVYRPTNVKQISDCVAIKD